MILAGCGGGSSATGGGSSVASTTTTVTPYKGRFSSGTVSLKDASGSSITLTGGGVINASGVASVSFPSNVTYPITVNVDGVYTDETTGASAVMAAGSPLMGMIPSASDAAAASGIPVTAVTHFARNMLPASGFSSASAVAAISGAASSVLGVSYGQAMLPPVFNNNGQTSDPTTLKLTALAHVIGQQGGTGDLGARLNNVAAQLAAGSAVGAVLPQTNLNDAMTAINGGASSVVPAGTVGGIPPFAPPNASLGNQIQVGLPTCTGGQVLQLTGTGLQCVGGTSVATATITGFSPSTGAAGTTVTITGTNLVTAFPPAPTVKFDTTGAGTPYTNVSNTGITFTVPAGLAAGVHTITIGGMSGMPMTVGTFAVTAPTVTAPVGVQMGGARQGVQLSLANAKSRLLVSGTSFNEPGGIATDGTTLYVADTLNNLIQKIDIATNVGGIVAGSVIAGAADGASSSARFKAPAAITTDGTNLFVADTGNHRIRKIVIATGDVSTLAGSALVTYQPNDLK